MIIDSLRQEHRNIEKLLLVLERELSVFDRGERPDYQVIHAVIAYFLVYPTAYHHPQEDMVFEIRKCAIPPRLQILAISPPSTGAAPNFCGGSRRRLRVYCLIGKSCDIPSTTSFSTSSSTNGTISPWKSVISFRSRLTL